MERDAKTQILRSLMDLYPAAICPYQVYIIMYVHYPSEDTIFECWSYVEKDTKWVMINHLTIDDAFWRRQILAACYQLVQSVLKIGSALAERVGQGKVGGWTALADSA